MRRTQSRPNIKPKGRINLDREALDRLIDEKSKPSAAPKNSLACCHLFGQPAQLLVNFDWTDWSTGRLGVPCTFGLDSIDTTP
ncbi:MAG: hypothetical protein Ct9H300mP8_04540 [Gammaproteobacteria bacterium]|nr:MAG: hypothetical protein Ct9H300mP8_04540 [Gammaproteobacteria bacterium]